ncbi:hypothetical protein [Streptomyces sp. CB02115]|uniref:hypothetical protein n=1 Tax=Streptomyces sp. CB02115 TaxID=1703939 RepID=UPI00093F62BE|nr:hypothetical protein [Streptomyces sp. CB02115]OKJ48678.1 hypothetical protein AMK28_33895 [Streptomyces sp. CB02115]
MRSRAAYESVRDRSAKAAGEALEQAELGPQDGDVRVTTHTTLDVLARTMTDGAVEGLGAAVAYGPGFTAAGPCLRAVRSGAAG